MKKLLYALGVSLLLIFSIQTAHASTFPSGCTATSAFSSTTGHPCSETLPDCNVGDLFSAVTGRPCTQHAYLPGCTSTIGYSVTTGSKCDGSTPLQQISQQLNQIIQNTSPATPTSTVTTASDPLQINASISEILPDKLLSLPTDNPEIWGSRLMGGIKLKYNNKSVYGQSATVSINGALYETITITSNKTLTGDIATFVSATGVTSTSGIVVSPTGNEADIAISTASTVTPDYPVQVGTNTITVAADGQTYTNTFPLIY
jgi:hypothetical protein